MKLLILAINFGWDFLKLDLEFRQNSYKHKEDSAKEANPDGKSKTLPILENTK